ncbi:MAG: hypothetical protein V3T72_10935 [Thermoanaerobaculia bacterium]
MATVNFSVPEEVKTAFNETFSGENKSALIAQLMREAVERHRRRQRRAAAIEALLDWRQRQPAATDQEIAEARRAIRP